MIFKDLELKDFDDFYNIILNNFPRKEIKDYEYMKDTFKKDAFKVLTLIDNNKMIGILSYYLSNEFVFIDYFAIDGDHKGKGLGSKMLKHFIAMVDTMVILEVEYPEDEQSIRRVAFYQKCGLVLNDQYDYCVLPVRNLKHRLYFHLMSYPKAITEDEFEIFYPRILKYVYGINI